MDWFRWHHGTVTDRKWPRIASRAGTTVANVIAVWAALLESASQAESRGYAFLSDDDAEDLDAALGMPPSTTRKVIAELCARGMIDDENRLAAWDKRQPKRERDDNSAERVRKFRERREAGNASEKRQGDASGAERVAVTPSNASVTEETPRGEEIREEEIRAKSKSKEHVSPDGDPPSRFDDFWCEYPRDEGKKKAREAWARKKLDAIADRIIADVVARKAGHGQWLDGYVPHATTYLNGERWNDAIKPRDGPRPSQQGPMGKTAHALMTLEAMKSGNGMATGSGFGGVATSRLLGFGSDPGGGDFAADGRGVGRVFDA